MKRLSLVVALFALLLSVAPSSAAPIIIGLPATAGTGNCYPFGCSYGGEYQQVYTASAFAGPVTINGLDFYNTQWNSGATFMNAGNWVISLSTTSADWNTLSSDYRENIGADNTVVFSGNLYQPWTFGNTLAVTFITPFSYNPARGNLLMDVVVTGASLGGGELFLDVSSNHTIMGRVVNHTARSGEGLVTGFVPDSGSSLLLLGIGIVFVGLWMWRKRRG